MRRIPLVSSVKSTIKAITEVALGFDDVKIVHLETYAEVITYFQYQMPEVKIIDFMDPNVDGERCLKIIKADPWLLFGGVIAITNNTEQKMKLEQLKEPNFLFIITRDDIEKHAMQIIKILKKNVFFLQKPYLMNITKKEEEGGFIIDTDPFEIIFYTNLLNTYLYNTDKISNADSSSLKCVMMELLLNAVEHGNCGISYDEKTKWLENGKNMLDLIAKKKEDPKVANKKIYIRYRIDKTLIKISLEDEGDGFDWKKRMSEEISPSTHGMGIRMSNGMVKNLKYNEKGNKVSFEMETQQHTSNFTPIILKSQEIVWCHHMQVVCREGEETNNLFYISSGRYAVYVNSRLVSVLTPNDIFIGEMAFLLDDKRSATIVSIGKGVLIKIPKMNFMHLIERYPYYGIFLSRLLATRLAIQSKQVSKLKEKKSDIIATNFSLES